MFFSIIGFLTISSVFLGRSDNIYAIESTHNIQVQTDLENDSRFIVEAPEIIVGGTIPLIVATPIPVGSNVITSRYEINADPIVDPAIQVVNIARLSPGHPLP